jgi:hypothetical protein
MQKLNKIGEIGMAIAAVCFAFLLIGLYFQSSGIPILPPLTLAFFAASPYFLFTLGLIPLITGRGRIFIYFFETWSPPLLVRLVGGMYFLLGLCMVFCGLLLIIAMASH